MTRETPASPLARLVTFLGQPPLALEVTLWMLLLAVTAGIRIYLWHLLPAYFWSDDGNSYAYSAFHWLDTGDLVFDGRRGPIYTLLIAAGLKIFGTMRGVIWLQHSLSALAILVTVGVARIWWGRVAVVPLFLCGIALAFYGLPLHLGHLVRNETLLFVFSAFAFGAWWLALKSDRAGWFFLAALAAELLNMTKSVFVVFPLVLVASALLLYGPGWRARLVRLALIAGGLFLPPVALKVYNATSSRVAVPEPQAGLLFFGRTAQWTKLDGGIDQDLKDVIRADIEDYRSRESRGLKLDNNIILKRTAVPHLWEALRARGQTPTDLDRLCRKFAVEAIRDQPAAFARQVGGDLRKLHYDLGVKNEFPAEKQVKDARKSLLEYGGEHGKYHPAVEAETMDAILAARIGGDPFHSFHTCLERAWLFQRMPVMYTTVALLGLLLFTRSKARIFFLGVAAVWFSNLILLSTVGRPLERYLMPLAPLMFWVLSAVVIAAWAGILRLAGGLTPPSSSPTTGTPQET